MAEKIVLLKWFLFVRFTEEEFTALSSCSSSPYSQKPDENNISNSSSPRARFAENPIIGPTAGQTPRLQRRKSALKPSALNSSKSSPNPGVTEILNSLESAIPTVTQSYSLPSSKLSTSTRRNSVILEKFDATIPSSGVASGKPLSSCEAQKVNKSKNIFEQSKIESINSNGAREGREESEIRSRDFPNAGPGLHAGCVMKKDVLIQEKARRELGLSSSPGLSKEVSLFSSASPSNLSKSFTFNESKRASSLMPPHLSAASPSFLDDDCDLPPSKTTKNPSLKSRASFSSDLVELGTSLKPRKNGFIEDKYSPMITQSSLKNEHLILHNVYFPSQEPSRPSEGTRRRSRTLIAPQKGGCNFENSNLVEFTVPVPLLTSTLPKVEDSLIPPPRPPRSNRRISGIDLIAQKTPEFTSTESYLKKSVKTQQEFSCNFTSEENTQNQSSNLRLSDSQALNGLIDSSKKPMSSTKDIKVNKKSYKFEIDPIDPRDLTAEEIKRRSFQLPLTSFETEITAKLFQSTSKPNVLTPNSQLKKQRARPEAEFSSLIKTPAINSRLKNKKFSSAKTDGSTDTSDDDDFHSADEGKEELWLTPREELSIYSRDKYTSAAHKTEVKFHFDESHKESNPSHSLPEAIKFLQSPFVNSTASFPKKKLENIKKTNKNNYQPSIIGAFPISNDHASSSYSISDISETSEFLNFPLKTIPLNAFEEIQKSQNNILRNQEYFTENGLGENFTSYSHEQSNFGQEIYGSIENLFTPSSIINNFSTKRPVFQSPEVSIKEQSKSLDYPLTQVESKGIATALSIASSSSSNLDELSNMLSRTPKKALNSSSNSHLKKLKNSRQNKNPDSSGFNFQPISQSWKNTEQKSWKASVGKKNLEFLTKIYGKTEIRRQEIIWELCETEGAFVEGIRRVIKIFVTPLRTPKGTWISGVPIEVAKLLDWLEDIVNLHFGLLNEIEDSRRLQFFSKGLVYHISELLLSFIPKLEIYQPYLVKFSDVTTAIEDMVLDVESDFGEFVRMQSQLPEFNHPDHQATSNLLYSSDSMIRVLQEVKGREDEYRNLKLLETKIRGLWPGFQLARRDRTLLAQGFLRRVQLSGLKESHDLVNNGSNSPSSSSSSLQQIKPYENSFLHESQLEFSPPTRLGSSIRDIPEIAQANESSDYSNSSISRQLSLNFFNDCGKVAATETSLIKKQRGEGMFETPDSLIELIPEAKRIGSRVFSKTNGVLYKKLKESPVHVFIFSDLMLLATKHNEGLRFIKSPKRQTKEEKDLKTFYCVLENIGISRVLSVDDVSDYDHLIKLKISPITQQHKSKANLNQTTTILLTFPDRLSGYKSVAQPYDLIQNEKFKWIAAFYQSSKFVKQSKKAHDRLENEDKKNPSNLIDPYSLEFQKLSIQAQEEEEQRWWSARHQKIKRYFQKVHSDEEVFPNEDKD
ncbi:hypothetical protein BY996DRAFT_6410192 [Phakopsora pachyrhizi]|nr:hypothetical protein BY996DRAFT_6410192 [Phakopsora pachyrhizi]